MQRPAFRQLGKKPMKLNLSFLITPQPSPSLVFTPLLHVLFSPSPPSALFSFHSYLYSFSNFLLTLPPSLPPSLSFFNSSLIFSLLTLAPFLLSLSLPSPSPLFPFLTSFPTVPSFLLLPLPHPLHPLLCLSLPSTASLPSLPHPSLPTLTPSPLLPFPLLPSSLLPSIPLLHSLLTLMPPCLPNPKPSLSFFPTFISLHFPLILLPFDPLFCFTTAMINNIDFSCY